MLSPASSSKKQPSTNFGMRLRGRIAYLRKLVLSWRHRLQQRREPTLPRRQPNSFNFRQIDLARGVVDVEADNLALLVMIDIEAEHDFPRLDAGNVLKLDIV